MTLCQVIAGFCMPGFQGLIDRENVYGMRN